MTAYEDFIARKGATAPPSGIADAVVDSPFLFPFQRALTQWALKRGNAAVFAAVGLGKTRMMLEYARLASAYLAARGEVSEVLILTPLAVAAQTVREAAIMGIDAHYIKGPESMVPGRITVTNYDRAKNFAADRFGVVDLDESSVIKHADSATRNDLITRFKRTRFRSAWTATPAPNDRLELGNHLEFLGIMRMQEMLSEYFVHDSGKGSNEWRIKGHAEQHFWRMIASCCAMVQRPSDLGFGDTGYNLPPAIIREYVIGATKAQDMAILDAMRKPGVAQQTNLFPQPARGLKSQRKARRVTLDERVAAAAEIVTNIREKEPAALVSVWCELNDESEDLQRAIAKIIPGCVEICGADSLAKKESSVLGFADGTIECIVTKASIAGQGVNWQRCHHAILVGPTHSFEDYHQIVGRHLRFMQEHPVTVHIVYSELEGDVRSNLARKQAEFTAMATEMRKYVGAFVLENVCGSGRVTNEYNPTVDMIIAPWLFSEAS